MTLSVYGIGQEAEQIVTTHLANKGWLTIPISEYTNNIGLKVNAPMLIGPNGLYISPDILAMKNGKMVWIEVKQKTEPTYFWKFHEWQHGIDNTNADAYLYIQEITGINVYIIVREIRSPRTQDLYLDSMNDISCRRRMKEDLHQSNTWLIISLKNAIEKGEYRKGNSEMVKSNNPEGWGLYWPRSAMKHLPW